MLAPVNPAFSSEETFTSGTIDVKWVQVPNANTTSDVQLEAASDAVGAFRFARPEDGAFNKENERPLRVRDDRRIDLARDGERARPIYSLNLDEDNVLDAAGSRSRSTPTRWSPPAATPRSARTTSTRARTT